MNDVYEVEPGVTIMVVICLLFFPSVLRLASMCIEEMDTLVFYLLVVDRLVHNAGMTVCLSALGVYVFDGCLAFAFSLVVVVGSKYARWLGLHYLRYETHYEIESCEV
jgi:hypothetical protein